MKILSGFSILICTLFYSCDVMMPYQKSASPLLNDTTLLNSAASKDGFNTLYTKYIKSVTSQGYIRYSTRLYYGLQEEILKEFAQFDVHKQILREEMTKFPIASFFPFNAVTIPSEKKAQAALLYKPLIDTLFSHRPNSSELHAEIIVLGFTDETPILADSNLYLDVVNRSQKASMNEQSFYAYASFYRAKEIGDILSKLILERKNNFRKYDKIVIDLIEEGRGTEFPDAKRSYNSEDDKRRIAKVYWKIL